MKRGGGWILGLLVVAVAAAGGGYGFWKAANRETVTVFLLASESGRDPTDKAMRRGAEFALQEVQGRAGRYKVQLVPGRPWPQAAAWIGTSESFLLQGDQISRPVLISVFDTHPSTPEGCFRISPGCERQGAGAAAWAKTTGAARVFLLRDSPSLRSKAIADAFEAAARGLGLRVEGPLDASVDAVGRILASKADLVFYSGEEAPYATASKVFSALRERGFAGRLVMGEADPEVSFLATRPSLVDGTYLVSPFAPAPPDLAARMGTTPGPHVTAGYFAMKAALDMIDEAHSSSAADLVRAAARLPYFDARGRAALRPCALYVARNGVFEFVDKLE